MSEAPVSRRRGSPDAASQIRTTQSRPTLAIRAESGDQATPSTITPSDGKTRTERPDRASKTLAVPSLDAVARSSPSGDQAMCRTVSVCPSSWVRR